VGTRPDAIKTAPVVLRLRQDRRFSVRLISTGQHRALLDEALETFSLRPERDFRVMRRAQTLSGVFSRVLTALDAELSRRRPDIVLVQGDTTSACAAAWAAFHRRVPVAHLESGLRTRDLDSPFPEELNRQTVDRLASVRLAPTAACRLGLLKEGASPASIYVTGNTVVDALHYALAASPPRAGRDALAPLMDRGPFAVVTLHRRESHGAILAGLLRGFIRASARRPDWTWVIASHPNPAARVPLSWLPPGRFVVLPPLRYPDFIRLLARSRFVATDSGGIQEEAPTLGLRYLVLRRHTERPEALGGFGRLVGVEPRAVENALVAATAAQPALRERNPFGDGRASQRTAAALLHWAGRGPRPRDFTPSR
jgi:UDP-N-acetylglucosamine 2-epimerase (non-hydrolysing)